jgi:hypothetical protein
MRLERAKQNAPATAEARAPATTMATTQAAEDQRFIKPKDINSIRQQEMLLDTNREIAAANQNIPIRFEHEVNRRYARDLAKRPAGEFLALTQLQQAREIFEFGPPEMRNDIKVMRDPQALFEYRRLVQPYVLQNCATSQCHGGANGGRLQLINPAESDGATYTNFYVLQSITKKAPSSGKVFSKGELDVIDRMQPARSLLLEYSIPTNLAEHTHPDVQGYHPPLRGTDDPRYRAMSAWISNSLRPDAKYGIDYRPATSRPTTTQATTEPTTHPAVRTTNRVLRVRG